MANKITISDSEVNSVEVDEKLRRQQRAQYLTTEHTTAPEEKKKSGSILYNTGLLLGIFGLLGGLLGWSSGTLLYHRPDLKAEARQLLDDRRELLAMAESGKRSPQEVEQGLNRLKWTSKNNNYYLTMTDARLNDTEKQAAIAELDRNDAMLNFIANLFFYAVSGMFIAIMLSIAEPIVERNSRAAIINGSVGAALGLAGGALVSFIVGPVHNFIINTPLDARVAPWRNMIADAAAWGILGMFLALAPGLIMRSWRKLIIGLLGGMAGGILGGVLFEPIATWAGQLQTSRLVAICAIGLVAGVSTGLIESVAKAGWLKVTAGLITGKQFVLYRNPTYIGSSLSCNIYLFKDPHVGPRHAAIHVNKSGFEIEDLPLGCKTLVNGKAVMRHRLRDGDEIRISNTQFIFHTRKPAA